MAVDGFKLIIKSEELKKLLQQRVEYHQRKSDVFAAGHKDLATKLEDFEDEAEEIQKYSNSTNSDLKSKAKHHRDRATYFKFVVGHLQDEDYILTRNDLYELEVIAR